MWRIALAAFLFLHGFAHQVGFLASWQLREFRDAPLDTTVLSRRIGVVVNLAILVGLATAALLPMG